MAKTLTGSGTVTFTSAFNTVTNATERRAELDFSNHADIYVEYGEVAISEKVDYAAPEGETPAITQKSNANCFIVCKGEKFEGVTGEVSVLDIAGSSIVRYIEYTEA